MDWSMELVSPVLVLLDTCTNTYISGDGSKEWTPEWLQKLDHRFGDDGDFWISYKDLLRKYQAFERTRLFGPEWNITQVWTTLAVPWTLDYHDTHFSFTVSQPGPTVIVLSQLDERYFRGLEGQYLFQLAFRVHKAGHADYLVRSQTPYRMTRSVNVELDLEPGDYEVRVKINALRDKTILPIEQVIQKNASGRREKLMRIGLAYDLSHSRGRFVETPEEKAARERHEQKSKEKARNRIRRKILAKRDESHYLMVKQWQRDEKRRLKTKERRKAKEAEKKARRAANKTEKTEKAAAKAKAEDEKEEAASTVKDKTDQEKGPLTPKSITEEPKTNKVEVAKEEVKDVKEAEVVEESKAEEKPKGSEEEAKPEEVEEQQEQEASSDEECESYDDISSVGSLSILSERELGYHIDHFEGAVTDSSTFDTSSDAGSDTDDTKDPWNAVVVVGLHVYNTSQAPLNLKVIRPIPFGDDNLDVEGDDCKTKGLDVDDSAMDATLEGDVKNKKKTISGDGSKKPRA